MRDKRRLVVELNRRSSDDLDKSCEREELNKTTIVNRALQVYTLIQDHLEAGGVVVLVDTEGNHKELTLL